MTIKKSTAILAATALIALGACSKKGPDDLPLPPVGSGGYGDGSSGGGGSGAITPGSQEDFIANTASDRIYFGFDQYNIDTEDMATLQSQAAWLRRYPATRVMVEGHADERGTRDYNLALGARRANAARNYLASLGVDPARIDTISYGKERPANPASTEEAWAANRRAVTVTIRR
jgi:peptidoglycan-associated lipoprotein